MTEDAGPRFHPVPPPTDEEVAKLAARVAQRIDRLVEIRNALRSAPEPGPDDVLGQMQARSIQATLPFWSEADELDLPAKPRRCAKTGGYSVHANVHLHAHDREGLEHLCRYGARPPFSLSRMQRLPGDRIAYQLKRPLADGRTVLVLEARELLRKLAALIPPPRANLVRYHGVFAPRSKLRRFLVPSERTLDKSPHPSRSTSSTKARPAAPVSRERRLAWAELLRRVYKVDVLDCLRCQGRMKVIAFITDPPVVRKILDHLAFRSAPLLIAPAARQLALPIDLIPASDLATPTHDLFANDWLDEPIEVDRRNFSKRGG